MNEEQPSASTKIPAHQWTHDGDEVLIVKCVNADMSSHNGFVPQVL